MQVLDQLECKVKTYIHKKTGTRYVSPGLVTDCTNSRDGTVMVIYWREGESNVVFVRDAFEFDAKFEEIEELDS